MYWRDPFTETWKRYRFLCKRAMITRTEALILSAQEVAEEAFWHTSFEVYQAIAKLRYHQEEEPEGVYFMEWEEDTLYLLETDGDIPEWKMEE